MSTIPPLQRVLFAVVAVAYFVLLGLLLSGWPDHRGEDRIPVGIDRPLMCGSYGCEEVAGG